MPLFKPRRPTSEKAPETKDSRAARLIAITTAGRPRWTPRDYAALASEGFGKNPIAYRCVRMIAEAAASAPLIVFADGVRDDSHPAARLMARPNPEQSGPEWLEGVYGALQTAGVIKLLDGETEKVGFASGSKAFGHRYLLGFLEERGLARANVTAL